MPEITISEELHSQLETEAEDGDVEKTMWKMVAMYRRRRNPESDVE